MLNELEQKIRQAIPELNELGVGAIYGYDNMPYYEVVFKNSEVVSFIDIVHYNKIKTLTIDEFNSLDISIIGKLIQLNHVLEYVKIKERWYDNVPSLFLYWNLKSNLLSEQSEELIKFLNEL